MISPCGQARRSVCQPQPASTVSYSAGSRLTIDIAGTTLDTDYTQLKVSGTVDLANVSLNLTGSFVSAFGDTFIIVSADTVSNPFANYAEGLAHWRARELERAAACFERSADIDLPASLFGRRARELAKNPPGEDWDPIRTLQEK